MKFDLLTLSRFTVLASQTRFWLTPFNSFRTVIKKKIKRRKFTGFIIIVEWLKKFVVVLNRLDSYCFMSLSYFYSSRDNLPIIGSLIVNSRPLRKIIGLKNCLTSFKWSLMRLLPQPLLSTFGGSRQPTDCHPASDLLRWWIPVYSPSPSKNSWNQLKVLKWTEDVTKQT